MTSLRYSILPSPVGDLLLTAADAGLRGIHMADGPARPDPAWRRDDARFRSEREQLAAYFARELKDFDVELDLIGTAFQRAVWTALQTIPYGTTAGYGQLAARLGRPTASRAVGAANGRNPVPIIVPCHRVIGANGTLTGYAGGLARKRILLDLESGLFAP